MVTPGQVLAGKFQVERVLGQGGMGIVVSAYHLVLGQRVALKFLLPEAMQHPEAVERFLREARAAVRLRSEHVGRVIDVGTLETGAPYIVMEYLEGGDLSQYVQRHGSLPVAAAVDFLLQACEAIAEAHSLGIVHRDLKPANLFITRAADGAPLVKVLDFGISKAATTDQDFSLTRTSAVMGSPGYMSPEQLRSTKDVDARSDIWSLGVILYELTSGRQPFVAESITELALKVAMDPLPPLYAPQLPGGFADVVSRCLEKDPNRRFGNVAELAAALAPFGPQGSFEAAEGIARVLRVHVQPMPQYARPATGVGTGQQQKPTTLSGAASQTYGGGAPPATKKTGLIVGVLGGAVVAGGIAVAIAMGGGKSKTADKGDKGDKPTAAAPTQPSPAPTPAPAPAPTPAPTPTTAAATPTPTPAPSPTPAPTPTPTTPTPTTTATGADAGSGSGSEATPTPTPTVAVKQPSTGKPHHPTHPTNVTTGGGKKPPAGSGSATKPPATPGSGSDDDFGNTRY